MDVSSFSADTGLDPYSILQYLPNLAGNVTYAVLYTILSIAIFAHVFFTGAKKDLWALVLPIGTTFAALGFFLRIALRTSQEDVAMYSVMYLFVVLSPAAFLAFNYILFGRLTAALEGDMKPNDVRHTSRYSFIPPRLVKLIFVTSDVITFCIQAIGGGMQVTGNYKIVVVGARIFLAGVSAQGASYALFTALNIVAHVRLVRHHGQRYAFWNVFSEPAVKLLVLLYVSSAGILVRSVYRIVEMAQGYDGFLSTHENFTFTLDALPLVIAVGVWALYWPGLLLRQIRSAPPPPLPSILGKEDAHLDSHLSSEIDVHSPV